MIVNEINISTRVNPRVFARVDIIGSPSVKVLVLAEASAS